jgi:hypothetical protein
MDSGCILNATEEFTVGNNVGIGAHSQLWTHIKYGDVLEGCRFNSSKPMIIGDDVWFVGHCIVSPIKAADKSMAMVGSVVTRDMEENHVYGGSPAKDLTEKLGKQFESRTLEKKMEMMNIALDEFRSSKSIEVPSIKVVRDESEFSFSDDISYFSPKSRTYTKKRTEVEMEFMRFLLPSYKFLPVSK